MRKYVECSITHSDTPSPHTDLVFDLRLMAQLRKKYLGNFRVYYGYPAAFLFGVPVGLEGDYTMFAVVNEVKYNFIDRPDEYAKSVFLPGKLKIDTTAFSTFQVTIPEIPDIPEIQVERCLLFYSESGNVYLNADCYKGELTFYAPGAFFGEFDSTLYKMMLTTTYTKPHVHFGPANNLLAVPIDNLMVDINQVKIVEAVTGGYGISWLRGPASAVQARIDALLVSGT